MNSYVTDLIRFLVLILAVAAFACALLNLPGCGGVNITIDGKVRPQPPGKPDKPVPDGYRTCEACGGDGIYVTPRGYKGRCFACNGSGIIEIPPPRPAPKPVWPRPRRSDDPRDWIIGGPDAFP